MDKKIGEFFMIKLSTHLTNEEKVVLSKCTGNKYELLSYIDGESYVLSEKGEYYYNDCFEITDIDFFLKQKYEKVTPYRIIKFYQYYLMNTKDEVTSWYRGRKDGNGNWEYDCVSDSLEEAFECL